MEEGLNRFIREKFEISQRDIRAYSPLTLAYIGDGIFDLVIRTVVVDKGNTSANQLHYHTSHVVKAATQAKMIQYLRERLTEEEADIYRRGRNAKSHTMAKNATGSDYRNATGFEALMGYLYLTEQMEGMVELIEVVLQWSGGADTGGREGL